MARRWMRISSRMRRKTRRCWRWSRSWQRWASQSCRSGPWAANSRRDLRSYWLGRIRAGTGAPTGWWASDTALVDFALQGEAFRHVGAEQALAGGQQRRGSFPLRIGPAQDGEEAEVTKCLGGTRAEQTDAGIAAHHAGGETQREHQRAIEQWPTAGAAHRSAYCIRMEDLLVAPAAAIKQHLEKA